MNVVTQSWIIVSLTTTYYHWLWENYEFKTTFETNRIRESESANASTITWERRQPTLRERRTFFALSPWLLGFTVNVGKRGTWVSFFRFPKFVMNFLKGVVSICRSFRSTGQRGRTNGFDRCFQVVDQYRARRILSEKSFALFIQYFLLARSLRDINNGRFAA